MLRVGNTYNKTITINNSSFFNLVFVGETLRHERQKMPRAITPASSSQYDIAQHKLNSMNNSAPKLRQKYIPYSNIWIQCRPFPQKNRKNNIKQAPDPKLVLYRFPKSYWEGSNCRRPSEERLQIRSSSTPRYVKSKSKFGESRSVPVVDLSARDDSVLCTHKDSSSQWAIQ